MFAQLQPGNGAGDADSSDSSFGQLSLNRQEAIMKTMRIEKISYGIYKAQAVTGPRATTCVAIQDNWTIGAFTVKHKCA